MMGIFRTLDSPDGKWFGGRAAALVHTQYAESKTTSEVLDL
jgi:hypothetical protein